MIIIRLWESCTAVSYTHLDVYKRQGIDLVRTIADMFAMYDDIHTEIIAASVRNTVHVTDCALAGADIATVPYLSLIHI